MPAITSADGTTIAYERAGTGPALVLVDGAMCYRAAGPMRPLATLLQDTFTVYTYDRRGRGESSDTLPYAVAREIEDLQALIAQAGGEAYVYGISSGPARLHWRRLPRPSPTTTRCSATAASRAARPRRSPFRRWSWQAAPARSPFSRPRRPPRTRFPPPRTGRSTARRTTWPRTHSRP